MLKDLLPGNIQEFYLYTGSLTTPPCSEIVVWNVFKQHIEVSQEQMDDIRKATYFAVGESVPTNISNNYRLPQPLYGRKIEEISADIRFCSHGNMLKTNKIILLMFFIRLFHGAITAKNDK